MGIPGLLQGLRPYTREGSITQFADKTVAVDASSWLHKSVYSIAHHYVETVERQRDAPRIVLDRQCIDTAARYMIARCQELLTSAHVAAIYLVLDGRDRCPLKVVTHDDRQQRRDENLAQARALSGQPQAAYEKYKACIHVCHELVEAVTAALQQAFDPNPTGNKPPRRVPAQCKGRVHIVESPYEADSQLISLCREGVCQAVITEDSDVVVYSVAAAVAVPILFKLDRHSGACQVVSTQHFLASAEPSAVFHNAPPPYQQQQQQNNKKKKGSTSSGLEPILQTFQFQEQRHPGLGARLFVDACMLAGTDYVPNQLDGVGLITAFKLIRQAAVMVRKQQDHDQRFRNVLRKLLLSQKAFFTKDKMEEYEQSLAQSQAVFFYHPVWEVGQQRTVYLSEPPRTANNCQETVRTTIIHRPLLDRFEGDLDFLGSLDRRPRLTGRRAASEPPPQQAGTSGTTTNRHQNKSNKGLFVRRPTVNPYKRHKQGDNNKNNNNNAVNNNKKHLLQPSSPNFDEPRASSQQQHSRLPEKENASGRDEQDVRYVKRSFPKDGTKTTATTTTVCRGQKTLHQYAAHFQQKPATSTRTTSARRGQKTILQYAVHFQRGPNRPAQLSSSRQSSAAGGKQPQEHVALSLFDYGPDVDEGKRASMNSTSSASPIDLTDDDDVMLVEEAPTSELARKKKQQPVSRPLWKKKESDKESSENTNQPQRAPYKSLFAAANKNDEDSLPDQTATPEDQKLSLGAFDYKGGVDDFFSPANTSATEDILSSPDSEIKASGAVETSGAGGSVKKNHFSSRFFNKRVATTSIAPKKLSLRYNNGGPSKSLLGKRKKTDKREPRRAAKERKTAAQLQLYSTDATSNRFSLFKAPGQQLVRNSTNPLQRNDGEKISRSFLHTLQDRMPS